MPSQRRWRDRLILVAAASAAATGPAAADYVSDPAMCGRPPIETQEMGMRLDAQAMWAIEYTCEWDRPIDLADPGVQLRLGYCSEPGLLFPSVFAFQVGAGGAGTLWVHEGPSGEPQRFVTCPD